MADSIVIVVAWQDKTPHWKIQREHTRKIFFSRKAIRYSLCRVVVQLEVNSVLEREKDFSLRSK